jgi:hypothetical protein
VGDARQKPLKNPTAGELFNATASRDGPGCWLFEAARHIWQDLPAASPRLDDGSKVAANMVYTHRVGNGMEPEMKLKKAPKRLKKPSKVEAAKPLSRAPWMPQG